MWVIIAALPLVNICGQKLICGSLLLPCHKYTLVVRNPYVGHYCCLAISQHLGSEETHLCVTIAAFVRLTWGVWDMHWQVVIAKQRQESFDDGHSRGVQDTHLVLVWKHVIMMIVIYGNSSSFAVSWHVWSLTPERGRRDPSHTPAYTYTHICIHRHAVHIHQGSDTSFTAKQTAY